MVEMVKPEAQKELPSNLEAEQMILGRLLHNNMHLEKVIEFLEPKHFFIPVHKNIYELILKFYEKGNIATPITLKNHVNQIAVLEPKEITGFEYLVQLVAMAQMGHDIGALAKHVLELSLRRELIAISEETITDAYKDDVDSSASGRIENVEQKLFHLASFGSNAKEALQLKDPLKSAISKIQQARGRAGHVSGVSTKFLKIDEITGGLQNSDLIIIAARPSMGKTSLAINIAVNAVEFFKEEYQRAGESSEKQKTVSFVSLEMSAEQVATRILSLKTGIEGSKIRSGTIGKEEFERLTVESSKLSTFPMFIDDTPALSIAAIRTRARRMKRKHNLGLLIVDYLQLVRPSGLSKDANRVQEIGEISQSLKAIAKELDIPVIALSQLSRAVESREDKRPLLSDLRESGNIEQDADLVMFIYRAEYYLNGKAPIEHDKNQEWQKQLSQVKNTAEIITAKQRNGPVGQCTLRFDSATTNFTNLDTVHK